MGTTKDLHLQAVQLWAEYILPLAPAQLTFIFIIYIYIIYL